MIWWVGHLFCLLCRNLCPCVLKPDDNSAELATLVQVNKKYQVRRASALSCTERLWTWSLSLERECAKVTVTPTGYEVTSDQLACLKTYITKSVISSCPWGMGGSL